jgi:hypothetical protein
MSDTKSSERAADLGFESQTVQANTALPPAGTAAAAGTGAGAGAGAGTSKASGGTAATATSASPGPSPTHTGGSNSAMVAGESMGWMMALWMLFL